MTDTTVKYSGTKGFDQGGNKAAGANEDHDLPKAKGKRVQVPSSPSKCIKSSADSLLDESKVGGSKRSEPSASAKVRSANNLRRDQNTNLGRGKSSEVVTD